MRAILCVSLLAGVILAPAVGASEKITLTPPAQLTRADIYVLPCDRNARATLVLCPGRNGNGQDLVENPEWLKFAQEEKLNLAGLSFASDDDPQDRGYFSVTSGSGQLLLDGLKRAFGQKQKPLLIYGFSRGAEFTYSFAAWKPEAVAAWCAYSATRWEIPEAASVEPKGIIACGEDDESNYSFSVLQFLKGRSLSKPWTWVSLAHTGHAWSPPLDEFARVYFASILDNPKSTGLWLDVETKLPVHPDDLREHPTLAAWLPDESVAKAWRTLHQP